MPLTDSGAKSFLIFKFWGKKPFFKVLKVLQVNPFAKFLPVQLLDSVLCNSGLQRRHISRLDTHWNHHMNPRRGASHITTITRDISSKVRLWSTAIEDLIHNTLKHAGLQTSHPV